MPNKKNMKKAKAAASAAVKAAGGTQALVQKIDRLADKVNKMKIGPMAKAGQRVGGAFGTPGLGRLAGSLVGKITGTGDYNVTVNSLLHPGSERGYAQVNSPSSAGFSRAGDVIRLRKREFVGHLFSPGTANAFAAYSYRLNPGNPKLFPWLSSVAAQGYEQWRPLGIVVELVSVASEYASSGTLGVYGASIDYQGLDPQYASKMEAENSDGAVSCKVSNDLMFGAECSPNKRPYNLLYVRQETSGISTNSSSINTFDLGNIQMFVQGVPTANLLLAEVWVTYDIEFEKQQLVGGPFGGGTASWVMSSYNGCSTNAWLGTSVNQYGSIYLPPVPSGDPGTGNGSLQLITGGPSVITLPDWVSGTFVYVYVAFGTASSSTYTQPTITFGGSVGSATALGSIGTSPQVAIGPYIPGVGAATGVSQLAQIGCINITTPTRVGQNTITFGQGGTLPTTPAASFMLFQIATPATAAAAANYGLQQINASPW